MEPLSHILDKVCGLLAVGFLLVRRDSDVARALHAGRGSLDLLLGEVPSPVRSHHHPPHRKACGGSSNSTFHESRKFCAVIGPHKNFRIFNWLTQFSIRLLLVKKLQECCDWSEFLGCTLGKQILRRRHYYYPLFNSAYFMTQWEIWIK